jgi:hypothetical protein
MDWENVFKKEPKSKAKLEAEERVRRSMAREAERVKRLEEQQRKKREEEEKRREAGEEIPDKEPELGEDVPSREPIQEKKPVSSVNLFTLYNKLLEGEKPKIRGLRDVFQLDSKGKPRISSNLVEIFEKHIDAAYSGIYIDNAQQFNHTTYAKIDKFFEQLIQLDKSDKNNPYRKPVPQLENMSLLRVIMRIWFTTYRATQIRNLNAGLNILKPKREKGSTKAKGLKIWIGDKEFELTPQNAKLLQEEYNKAKTYSFHDPKAGEKTAKRKQELAEKQKQLEEILSKIKEIDTLLENTDERKNEDGLLDLANMIDSGDVKVAVGGKSLTDDDLKLVSSQELRENRKELLRQSKELEATIRVKPSIEDQELIEATMAVADPSYARSRKKITREGPEQTQSMRRYAELGAYDTPPFIGPKPSKEIADKKMREARDKMYEAGKFPKGGKVGKALDLLMVELGVTSNTIIKEDNSKILQELNKKDKRLVKTLLQLAHPTEYFNEDALKLGELITVLKSLGVVNDNKTLKKKVLKYEDENLKVVKRAVRLRREYEKLYKSIREVIYPKSGEKDE